MSQSDSFIDEVTEEVRRERLFGLFRRYGWIAALTVVVIVGGAAWNEYRKSQERAVAQDFGDAVLAALENDDPVQRVAALGAIQTETVDAQALRVFMQSSEAAEAGETAEAVKLLADVAANSEVPLIYRSLATYRKLALEGETLSPADRRSGYETLTAAGAPLRMLALEQIALTHVEEGDIDAAVAILDKLQNDADMTPDLRRRTSQLIVSLGGSPEGASD